MNEIQFLPAKPIVVLTAPLDIQDRVKELQEVLEPKLPDYHVIFVFKNTDDLEFNIVSIKEATPEMISEIKDAIERMERMKK